MQLGICAQDRIGIPKLMATKTKMHDRNDKNIEKVDKI